MSTPSTRRRREISIKELHRLARRGSGEGSIYQRANGRWIAYTRLSDGRKKFFSGATRRDVQRQLAQALHAQQEGTLVTVRDASVAQYLERWLAAIEPSVRVRTHESYALNVRRLIPHLGRGRLSALEPAAIQACYAKLLHRGLSARSVEQAHTVLHNALRQAVRWNLLARNPAEAVTAPRPRRRELLVLSEEQVRRLLQVTRNDRLHPLWALLVTTGLRAGEALGLKWTDLDLEAGSAVIQRALQRQSGRGLVFVEPKTARSRRTVPLPDGTAALLREARTRQAAERLQAGPLWQDSGLVFCQPNGRPLDPSWLGGQLHRATASQGLPPVRVHDLRHTAATHLLTRGVHPKIVQDLLGHSTITLTLDTYSHVLPSLTRQAAAHMNALFPEALLESSGT